MPKISVANLGGREVVLVELPPEALVSDVQQLVLQATGVHPSRQRLVTSGAVLSPASSLHHAGILRDAQLSLLVSPLPQLVIGADDGRVGLWSADSGQPLWTGTEHRGPVRDVDFSADGALAASASDDCTAKLWSVEGGACRHSLRGHSSWVTSVRFSPNSAWVVTASYDATCRQWDADTGECVQVFVSHEDSVMMASFSPDGKLLVTGSADRTAKIWTVETGHCTRTFEGFADSVLSASLSPDGACLLTVSGDCCAMLWKAETGECMRTSGAQGRWDRGAAAVQPSGQGTRLWSAQAAEYITTYKGEGCAVKSAAFSPDGKWVLTTSCGGAAHLWDPITGECARIFGRACVLAANFSTDSAWVVTTSGDGDVSLWSADTGECVRQLPKVHLAIQSVALAPLGKASAIAPVGEPYLGQAR